MKPYSSVLLSEWNEINFNIRKKFEVNFSHSFPMSIQLQVVWLVLKSNSQKSFPEEFCVSCVQSMDDLSVLVPSRTEVSCEVDSIDREDDIGIKPSRGILL
jgi:hypothetical protein